MEPWVLQNLSRVVGSGDRKALPALAVRCLIADKAGETPLFRAARGADALGRGLIVTPRGVIPDYPRIRRVFHLRNAVTKYYYSPFYAEEQVPGYHVRVARVGDEVLAFNRGGRCCPFTTDRAEDLLPAAFFDEHPELIVCLSVDGNGTPYPGVDPSPSTEELGAWAIDLQEWNVREPVPMAAKYELCAEYGMRQPPHLGPLTASDVDSLEAWVAEIDRRARGVIVKPSERHHRPLKYSTASALLTRVPVWRALERNGGLQNPILERLVRAACSSLELGRSADDWDWENVGRAVLEPIADALKDVAAGEPLRERRQVWLHRKEAAERLVPHLQSQSPGCRIETGELRPEGGGWRLDLVITHIAATQDLRWRLSGASFLD